MGTRIRTHLVVAALAAVALLAACGEDAAQEPTGDGLGDPQPTTPTDDPTGAPDATEDPDPGDDPPPGDGAGTDQVTAWFARETPSGVWLEPETVHLADETVQVLRAAVEAIVSGQSVNPGLTTLVPAGVEVLDVRIEEGVAVVDLSGEVAQASGGSAEELAFAQQLAQTATQFEAADAVRLLVDGQPVDELWGHLDWSKPITADPQALAPIIVETPSWGASRPPGPVTASGTSVTFESTVELRLVAPDGTVVEDTFTTAAQPDVGQRGPWTHTFDTEATTAGTWTIEAVEPDPSGGEGPPPFTTSVEFTVS